MIRDAVNGEPVEDFGIRCFAGEQRSWMQWPAPLRSLGHHPGGVLQLEGVVRGPHVLVVEPAGDRWFTSDLHPFEMTDTGAPPQVVMVSEALDATARIRRRDGSRIVGTRVELVRPLHGEPVRPDMEVVSLQESMHLPDKPLLLARGETDAEGEVVLRGPCRERLALRVLGPGNAPLVQAVILQKDQPIEVVVPAGATVSGRIGPPELLQRLFPSEEELKGFGGRPSAPGPGISLVSRGDSAGTFPPGDRPGAMERDGSFRLQNVPAGSYEVRFLVEKVIRSAAYTSAFTVAEIDDLSDGETRHLDLDLSWLLPATVRGTVLLNGEPAADCAVTLLGGGDAVDPSHAPRTFGVRTDAAGRFETTLWPAEYRLRLWQGEPAEQRWLPAPDTLRVQGGETITHTFNVPIGSLELTVLAPGGRSPLEGVRLLLTWPEWQWSRETEPTDAHGRVTTDRLSAATLTVAVRPRNAPPRADPITAGTVTITPPRTTATVTLPPSAGY